MASIREIAVQANVSPAAVSRVLSNDPTLSVAPETRKRILAIAEELNYIPAKKRKTGQGNKSIGIITTVSAIGEEDDPYYKQIRKGIREEVERLKLTIKYELIITELDRYMGEIDKLGAILIIGGVCRQTLAKISEKNPNIVAIDNLELSKHCDSVYSDLRGATMEVLDCLYEMGHRDIHFIGGEQRLMDETGHTFDARKEERLSCYEEWMALKGLGGAARSYVGSWGALEGLRLAQELLDSEPVLPSAIVVASDPMALGVMRALQKAGIKIPEEITIVSFDDIEVAEFLTPTLSTVRLQMNELGKVATRLAHERVEGIRSIPIHVAVPGELILRESSVKRENAEKNN